jgi:hypothetical protein
VVGQAVVRMETGTICRAGRRKTVPPNDHTRFVAGIVQVNMGSEKILGVSNALARQNAERATQQPASPIPAFAKPFWLLASGFWLMHLVLGAPTQVSDSHDGLEYQSWRLYGYRKPAVTAMDQRSM